MFETLNEAHVGLTPGYVSIRFLLSMPVFDGKYGLSITCRDLDYPRLSMARDFTSLFPSIYTLGLQATFGGARVMWENWLGEKENARGTSCRRRRVASIR